MSASLRGPGTHVSQSLLASTLLLRAAFFSVRCSQAIEGSDRAAANAQLSELREAIRELQGMDKPPEHDIARLLELESKLSRAIIGMQIHPALIDDESDAAPTR